MERPQTSINTGFAAIFYHFYLQKSGYNPSFTGLQGLFHLFCIFFVFFFIQTGYPSENPHSFAVTYVRL